jgi:cytochrome b561
MKQIINRYDPVAVFLHWTIALLIVVMIVVGLTMEDYPMNIRFIAFNLHKATGITILGLSVFRLIWRFMNPPPALPPTMPAWEKAAAWLSHWALYGFIIIMPLSGWLMVSASAKYPIVFFGLGEAPFIPMPADAALTKQIGHSTDLIHYYLGLGAIALILVHAGAAMKHHFLDRDFVLVRMLPRVFTRHTGEA